MTKILLVEDEAAYRDPLTFKLRRDGFEVVAVATGTEALTALSDDVDIVLLDLMLPGISGTEVCRSIRTRSRVPIIMLTAREEADRVVGIELGADDYVVKPFSVRELMARVKIVLRRTAPRPAEPQAALRAGELCLDLERREASWRGRPFELTTAQFDLLRTLMARPGRVFSREELLNQVWGYDYYGDTRAVDSAIKRLRARLREVAPEAELILTARDLGYKLSETC